MVNEILDNLKSIMKLLSLEESKLNIEIGGTTNGYNKHPDRTKND